MINDCLYNLILDLKICFVLCSYYNPTYIVHWTLDTSTNNKLLSSLLLYLVLHSITLHLCIVTI